MDMQWRNRELASEDERRRDVERERAGGLDRTDQGAVMVEEPGMTPVGVKPAEPVADASAGTPPVGAAVVGGAIGAVAGAIVAGPAGALVGGAVGAAGGAVVAKSGPGEDRVIDIDRPEMSGTIRRPRDEDMDSGF